MGVIERGILAYLGFGRGDTEEDRAWMLAKIVGLRVFEDDRSPARRMTLSVADVGGGSAPCQPVHAVRGLASRAPAELR